MYILMFMRRFATERSYDEEESRRRDDAESKIAHETTDALTLSGHARTPSGCKSGDIKRTIIKKVRPGRLATAESNRDVWHAPAGLNNRTK